MEYDIVVAHGGRDFIAALNLAATEGWEPIENLIVLKEAGVQPHILIQLVKRKKK